MDASKTQIVRDIAVARTYLEKALDEVLNLPVQPGTAAKLATHTLSSYVVLAKGTVDLLSEELREYPVRDVHIWLDGLARGTGLMEQLLEQIRSGTIAQHDLKWEEVELATLIRRLCGFCHDDVTRRGVSIDFDAQISTGRAWTDRTIAASLFHEILSFALRRSRANSTIKVHVEELRDRIISGFQDHGAPFRPNERQCLEESANVESSRPEEFSLNLSGQLAERLGGKLWYESANEEGLRVYVSLPKPGNSTG